MRVYNIMYKRSGCLPICKLHNFRNFSRLTQSLQEHFCFLVSTYMYLSFFLFFFFFFFFFFFCTPETQDWWLAITKKLEKTCCLLENIFSAMPRNMRIRAVWSEPSLGAFLNRQGCSFFKRTTKTLIRLRECAVWLESTLCALVRRYIISCCVSYALNCGFRRRPNQY